jgi:hypothetical protein
VGSFVLSNFLLRLEQLFSVRATSSNFFLFEQLSTRFKLYSMNCLHMIDNLISLLPTSKDPGYEVASFPVIFF